MKNEKNNDTNDKKKKELRGKGDTDAQKVGVV